MELHYHKRTEDLGYATATTLAVTSDKKALIIRTNSASNVVEASILKTPNLGQGYSPAKEEEVLKALCEVEQVISGFIKAIIEPENEVSHDLPG